MSMHFSKGYLGPGSGGGKPMENRQMGPMKTEEPGEGHEAIHSHLQSMHEQDGKAHSHVVHHGDGTHTSHHIHEDGNVEGPHEHGSTEEMVEKMHEMGGGAPEGEMNEPEEE